MDLNFKCPLCETYFDSKDDLTDHVKTVHTSYYYDTYLVPPVLFLPSETPLIVTGAPSTVITTEPVSTPEVLVEPVVADDGCCDCGCCSGDAAGAHADSGGDCGDCDCDCDCVVM
ncbi:uncharacterized protein LOC129723515 [Wyeomyia smithii]|uniref:uncharacterized protein LOC129723515 n=1 Tax=Wyeomyia smithii TaxID=174621 RepID=UPI002467D4E7|nr:uncharacterized protein LOC129723515 [Wyeomyia smithii]